MVSRETLKAAFVQILNHLGGEAGFRKVIDEFYDIMKNDILIGYFFEPFDVKHIASQQCDFLLSAALIRPAFKGNGPGAAHLGLPPILDGHFDRRHTILRELLMKKGVAKDLINTWIEFEQQFRGMIVTEE